MVGSLAGRGSIRLTAHYAQVCGVREAIQREKLRWTVLAANGMAAEWEGTMRRWLAVLALGAAGCSNAPIAGFLDLVHPSHVGKAAIEGDPLAGGAIPPAAPPVGGGQLLPPGTPPPGFSPPGDNSFMPPLSPREPSPLPPESRSSPNLGPLTLPNT
jgi:hypothetical protein